MLLIVARIADPDSPKLGSRSISHLLFADDLLLASSTVDGLQRLLDRLGDFCNHWGIEINLQKTNVIVCKRGGRTSVHEKWRLMDRDIQVVPSTKYLGVGLSGSRSYAKHRSYAVPKAMRALFCLTGFYFRNRGLPV